MTTSKFNDDVLLLLVLRQIEIAKDLRLAQWDLLIRQARANNLLGFCMHAYQRQNYWIPFPIVH